uniref:Uncharacterized protein n=1 Tax=Romanomermis culicivorax TaxID=13658 RepID=A0A915KWW1_ROMCU
MDLEAVGVRSYFNFQFTSTEIRATKAYEKPTSQGYLLRKLVAVKVGNGFIMRNVIVINHGHVIRDVV